jgi:hypothetical protein
MTDRELLELAAKAAGIECEKTPIGFYLSDEDRNWNPLTDDGDALRLAVKLRIRFAGMGERACAFIGLREFWEDEGSDPFAATRRAITRAAAEIGKEK